MYDVFLTYGYIDSSRLPLISGLMALAATAIPAAIPPPLTGTKMASNCGTWFKNSVAIVPFKIYEICFLACQIFLYFCIL